MSGKIFGIGLSKTGTTSLARALDVLGYRTKDYMGVTRYVPGDISSLDWDVLRSHDAFTDTPIPSFYKELDQAFPGSKFILTVRSSEDWLRSCRKQFTKRKAEKLNESERSIFLELYGSTAFEPSSFRQGYEQFVEGVLEYFEARPDDLLVMDICGGDGWEKLCPFLGIPVPDAPFPRLNVTAVQTININDVVDIARAAGEEVLRVYGASGTRFLAGREAGGDSRPVKKLENFVAARVDRARLARARRRARNIILRGLKRISGDLPIVGREEGDTPYEKRAKWSHLWLIEPLGGFGEGAGQFAVSVGLVEADRPVLGVVYVPATGTVFFGKRRLGSFRMQRDGTVSRLPVPDGGREMLRPEPSGGDCRSIIQRDGVVPALCRMAEGSPGVYRCVGRIPEWEIAAADAVARFSGSRVIGEEGEEPVYNRECMTQSEFSAFRTDKN